ncbi:hypothetical protein V8F33_005546 [Rhypophila sp. PSN 637]
MSRPVSTKAKGPSGKGKGKAQASTAPSPAAPTGTSKQPPKVCITDECLLAPFGLGGLYIGAGLTSDTSMLVTGALLCRATVTLNPQASVRVEEFGIPFANPSHPSNRANMSSTCKSSLSPARQPTAKANPSSKAHRKLDQHFAGGPKLGTESLAATPEVTFEPTRCRSTRNARKAPVAY